MVFLLCYTALWEGFCFLIYLSLWFFMAALGLRCWALCSFSARASLQWLLVAGHGLLALGLKWLLPVGPVVGGAVALEHRLSSCGTFCLAVPRHVGSSRTRGWTHVPCIGRQILHHWTTREVLPLAFKIYLCFQVLPCTCRLSTFF